ncbi:alpha/beta fold hydrolase [Gordonia soli]|uniref:Putative hydrolase n=1 Tax=Gordonia soli NBRC 108243 TaxID=1223545 RepID=M0QMN8_9ACTN|nr:alpha/beta hydrolase [Gordonia soli]GAC69900.1 putative hydrolase [Gordonia soli NBRC 108243]
MDNPDRIGWLAGVAGVAALGAVAAGGVARNVTRRRTVDRVDPHDGVDFAAIYDEAPVDLTVGPTASSTVTADDGVSLAARTVTLGDGDESTTPEFTVVFVHGFSLRMASWHFQRFALARLWAGRNIRMVFFDHRGHGASDPAPDDTATITQLADDTAAVLRALAPSGPVVLVSHSMGGMAVMALARRHPALFSPAGQVAGVALIATASRGITETGLGEGLRNPVVDVFRLSVRRAPALVQAGRGITRRALEPVLVAASFGSDFFSPTTARAVESMIQGTSLDTLVNFLHALEMHDESLALPILAQVPTVVVGATADRLTPFENSVRMFSELGPDSRLVKVDGAGHMVQMEQPDIVTDAIADLVSRARAARPQPRRRWWQRGSR